MTRYDSEWLADQATAQSLSSQAMDALKVLYRPASKGGFRVRLHLLPSGLEEACRLLDEAGFEVLAYPEPTTVYAFHDPTASQAAKDLPNPLALIESVAARVKADWAMESFPAPCPDELARFNAQDPQNLMRELKMQFDPQSLLNRGCFVRPF